MIANICNYPSICDNICDNNTCDNICDNDNTCDNICDNDNTCDTIENCQWSIPTLGVLVLGGGISIISKNDLSVNINDICN